MKPALSGAGAGAGAGAVSGNEPGGAAPMATAATATPPAPSVGGAAGAGGGGGGGVSGSGPAPALPDIRALYGFSNQKAGMKATNPDHINQVIYDMSKHSAHFANQQRKHAAVTAKIDAMRAKLAAIRSSNRVLMAAHTLSVTRRVEKLVGELHATRDLSHTWIHVDMDMFYAAVEIRDRPELKHLPVAVGGIGMISTSNYEARKYGVRAAMPGFIAKKLCPHLVFVHSNFEKYHAVAEQTRAIFAEYDPHFDAGSLDEAYLDITNYLQQKNQALISSGSPPLTGGDVAREIRKRIFDVTQLTASAGVGPNRMLSKMCGEQNKPNGQFDLLHDPLPPPPGTTPAAAAAAAGGGGGGDAASAVADDGGGGGSGVAAAVASTALASAPNRILQFMDQLSVRKIPGIGQVMERVLKEIGIRTCKQVRDPENAAVLFEMFSDATSRWLIESSLGLGSSERSPEERERKSISCERTFREINTPEAMREKIRQLAISLADDISKIKGLRGKTITLKLKNVKFQVTQRSITLSRYISSAEDLTKYALQMLAEELDRLTPKSFPGMNVPPTPPPPPPPPPPAPTPAAAAAAATATIASTQLTGTSGSGSASGAVGAPPSAVGVATAAAPQPLLRLRLMGIRLSAFHPSCDDSEGGGGGGEAGSGGQKSIAKFLVKSEGPKSSKSTSAASAAASLNLLTTPPPAGGVGVPEDVSAAIGSKSRYARANRYGTGQFGNARGPPGSASAAAAAAAAPTAPTAPTALTGAQPTGIMDVLRPALLPTAPTSSAQRQRMAVAQTQPLPVPTDANSVTAAAAGGGGASAPAEPSGSSSSGEWLIAQSSASTSFDDEYDGFGDAGSGDEEWSADAFGDSDMTDSWDSSASYDMVYDCSDSSSTATAATGSGSGATTHKRAFTETASVSAAAAPSDPEPALKRAKADPPPPAPVLVCPVCNRSDVSWSINELNRHLDQCLNASSKSEVDSKSKPVATTKPVSAAPKSKSKSKSKSKAGAATAAAVAGAGASATTDISRYLKAVPPPPPPPPPPPHPHPQPPQPPAPPPPPAAPNAKGVKRRSPNSIDRFFALN